ncbi:hypothetical protein Pla100_54420 [Neorhodopirellula pilleata]|uniref:Uncharacterized protein n=1 Tax=Neorhodopirellula pilleata TaxID=2714738 RepID=A0A5C5ZTN8_9BACT|nr:hypothetical protein Pla100_54420 [Neorhodopirellula pilleata]
MPAANRRDAGENDTPQDNLFENREMAELWFLTTLPFRHQFGLDRMKVRFGRSPALDELCPEWNST